MNVQRQVSVFKMVTVLEGSTTEEQCSVVHFFCGQKDSMQRIFIKKCFLFMVGSAGRIKRFNWVEKFSQGRFKVTDNARPGHPVEIATEKTM
jgi:hypothetical protein